MAEETPEEKEALAKLDEVTRQVAWGEEVKEEDRELSTSVVPIGGRYRLGQGGFRGPLGWMFGRFRVFRWKKGDPVPEPVDDPDPGDEHGLRESLRDDAKP
jgi:hypothetical protein